MSDKATQPGAETKKEDANLSPAEIVAKASQRKSARDEMLESLSDRQEEARRQYITEELKNDPGGAALQKDIEQQQADNRAAAEAEGLLEPLENDGAESVQPMHEQSEEPVREDLLKNLQDDPLKDYIIMHEDKPMFVTKVNGEQTLVPLDEARRKLQIRTAAELDLQNARKFSSEVEKRNETLTAKERAFEERVKQAEQAPPEPEVITPELDEKEIRQRAEQYVKTSFSGTEEEATSSLVDLLLNTAPKVTVPASPSPAIDMNVIRQEARNAATEVVSTRDAEKDLVEGYNAFTEKFEDIANDERLFQMADSMTDEIAKEHPEWSTKQVMLEAGKRTSEWVESLRGTSSTGNDDDVTTDTEVTSEHTQPSDTQTRQQRKQNLVPIPVTSQTAAHSEPKKEDENRPQTPQEAFRQVREARGQPV